jgi:FAD/FMN-containing dehydrogenase
MAIGAALETDRGGLTEAAIQDLKTRLRGPLIVPGDAEYTTARQVYNAMIDRYPRLIARCHDVADVMSAVNFGCESGLTVAVRGGGHNGAGLGICDDGLVIDLSLMRSTRVDPVARTVRVEGGSTWGEVDHATHAFGLATPGGLMSTTGVGGLTLGGGLGHLTRACGLSIDNLLEVDVVLADGTFVTANADQHPDLYWAVRGGGGNFGVITSFVFELHPISTVVGGPMLWPMHKAKEVLQWYREFIAQAPDDINGFFAFLKVPPGPPFPDELHTRTMCGIVWCYTGPADNVEVIYGPIRRVAGGPVLDWVAPLPHPELQRMFDPIYPPGLQWYWRADFVDELSDEAIDLHIQYGSRLPSLQSAMHLFPINGAASRVGKQDTAWSYRDATWGEVIVGVDPDPANAETIKDWTIAYWDALHPYSAGGAYVNMMMDEGVDRIRAAYRDNYDRLVMIKNRYDPKNVFHVNQNIEPSV